MQPVKNRNKRAVKQALVPAPAVPAAIVVLAVAVAPSQDVYILLYKASRAFFTGQPTPLVGE